MPSDDVLFVSAGMLRPKKRDHVLARRQLYLNYGALTLATLLARSGVRARLVHGRHEDPAETFRRLERQGHLPSRHPVMLSLPSFYAVDWAREFCGALKRAHPDAVVIAGGRWVTGPDPNWVREAIPGVDHVVTGLGEAAVHGLLNIVGDAPTGVPAFPLDHTLVERFEAFQPSIETSRGCGMGCSFCEERDIPLSSLRDPALLADHLAETVAQYGTQDIHPYMESSFFLPNPRWARRLADEVRARGLDVGWRCETRVDAMKPETVGMLAEAGLKVIDLGLETASPRQILAMKKASDADRYLRSASELMRACRDAGVWVKANVLLYAGESESTLAETTGWLDDHSDAIKGVSVGPVVVFGPPVQADVFLEDLEARGARRVDPASAARSGLTSLHLSAEIDADAAEAASLELTRRYMDEDDYFDLKAFSYFPRDYLRSDFDADVAASETAALPFRATRHAEPSGSASSSAIG